MTIIKLIISIILLAIIIIHNIYQKKKYKEVYKDSLYNKTKKLTIFLYVLSALAFISFLVINILENQYNLNTKTIITSILNSLSIGLLIYPFTIKNLYIKYFKDEEKYSHIKTIITTIYDKNIYKKFKEAGINLLYISSKDEDLKIKTINEEDISSKIINKTLHIKSDNKKIVDKYIDKSNTIKEFNNLEKLYEKINYSRSVHDNYIKSLKFIIRTYLITILTYICLLISQMPLFYSILHVMLLKVSMIILTHYLYRKLPYEKDIMQRKVKPKNILIETQELFLTIIESFCILFVCLIPYMFAISQGSTQELANTMYFVVFTYSILFTTFSKLSDSFIIKNIYKSLKNVYLIIFTLSIVGIILLLNFTEILDTRNIELKNNISCLVFSLVPILFIEITKLARYSTLKRRKKNELKNNQKQKRSKPNNS